MSRKTTKKNNFVHKGLKINLSLSHYKNTPFLSTKTHLECRTFGVAPPRGSGRPPATAAWWTRCQGYRAGTWWRQRSQHQLQCSQAPQDWLRTAPHHWLQCLRHHSRNRWWGSCSCSAAATAK